MKKCIIFITVLIYSFLGVNMPFAAANIWTQKTNFGGVARDGAIGFSIDSKGYIGTGYDIDSTPLNDFWKYDPAADTWTQMANFGGEERYNAVGFSIGSKGYIGTGYNDSSGGYDDFWEFNPGDNKWTQKANFGGGGKRDSAVGFSIGNKGYIGTGLNDSSEFNDFWEYDPAADTWTQKADFGGVARDSAIGFSIDSKGYIGTGYDIDSTPMNDFWEYDPATDTWTQMANFGGIARYSAVGFSIGSKGYIGAGTVKANYKDFWEYDLDTDTWTKKADFGGAARYSSVGFAIGSKGYIGTGNDDLTKYKDLWEYDPYDRIPNQFTFTDQTNVSLSMAITSNTITVSEIDTAVPISITGGTYSINGGSYTSTIGTVNNGDKITLQLTSSGSYSTTTNATLTIGGISDTFSVTTQAAPASSDGSGGGGCFIATAAFGSPLAGQVETLRQFRDRYLLTNALGRKFVAWYYRNGPAAASFIEDKPLAKAAVRAALYPLIGFSLLLINGILPYLLMALTGVILFLQFRSKKLSST